MAVAMTMDWPGVTVEQYEDARRLVRWETDPAEGGIFHVAWFAADGLHVVDVWESPEHFRRFAEERLMPVAKGQLEMEGEPNVEFHPAHAVFVPGAHSG